MPKTERGKQYDLEYIKAFQRQFMLKCNRKTEPELVEWLESKENVQTYLKELIRKDIENSQK